jgi:hypothetical protein
MPDIFIYQISYVGAPPLDPGFLVLNNVENVRPDWFEYWPIRRYLLSERLDENAFYGFLSPRFREKTNLSAAAVREFVRREASSVDVIIMSPSLQVAAYFRNVFIFGEFAHPGLLDAARQFFERIGLHTDLDRLVTTSNNEVYSNYLIARPRFWRAWLEITERLFAMAESSEDPLGPVLRRVTPYRGHNTAQLKIFLLERLATWILASEPRFAVKARYPFASRSRIYKLPGAIACDALKIAYLASNRQCVFIDLFSVISRLRRLVGWQIRFLAFLRFTPIRAHITSLSSRWTEAGDN